VAGVILSNKWTPKMKQHRKVKIAAKTLFPKAPLSPLDLAGFSFN
jgi:hypothetical protein